MKRTGFTLLVAACMGTGCMNLPRLWPEKKPPAPAPEAVQTANPRPVVTAEQINEGNAHDMASALMEELDAQTPPIPAQTNAAAKQDGGK